MSKNLNLIQDYCLVYIVDNMTHAQPFHVQEIFSVMDVEVSKLIEQVLLILVVLVVAGSC